MSRTMTTQSETSMTKSDRLPRTYATLRFNGDDLEPKHISEILREVDPKRSHRKGETYRAGRRAGDLRGRTGIWYYDTRDLPSNDLAEHARRILALLGDQKRIDLLRDVLKREHANASLSLFWMGPPGTPEPEITEMIEPIAMQLGASIETDFQHAAT
jgi:Domain of unknown function (DUF4279)